MTTATTLLELLSTHSANSSALVTSHAGSLNFEALRTLIDNTVSALNARGIGRRERVAIALPYGPEFVGCLLSISCGSTCVPLNPNDNRKSLETYLQEFNINALVVEKGSTSEAVSAAQATDTEVLETISHAADPIGTFQFSGAASGKRASHGGIADSEDVAMIIDTGNNGKSNMIGLSHYELVKCATEHKDTIASKSQPVFHISGLISTVLAPLAAVNQLVFS